MIDVEAFRRDGFVVVPGAVPAGTLAPFIEVLQAKVHELAADLVAAGQLTDAHEDKPFDRRLAAVMAGRTLDNRTWDPVLFCAEFCELITSPAITGPLAELLGDEITYQGNAHLRPYLPHHLERLPWHQDAQFYGAGTEWLLWQMAQVWLPLTDADLDSGCLAVVPGSHHWGLLGGAVPGEDNVGRSSPDRQEEIYRRTARRVRFEPVRLIPVRAGDLVIFTNLLAHTGTENRSDVVRWSIDARFEATVGSRPLSAQERSGFEVMHRRINGRRYVPLRVRGADGPENWHEWRHRRERVAGGQP